MSVGGKKITPQQQEDADVLYNQARVLLDQKGKPEQALEVFRRAAEMAPSDAVLAAGVGEALNDLTRYPEAVEAFDRSNALDPQYLLVYCNKGFALTSLGRYREAYECLSQGLLLDPRDPTIHYNLACTSCLLGDREQALAFLEKALALDEKYYRMAPEDSELASLYGDPAFQALLKR
jgi:tetratricopeptide (TPR) repeat protein